MNYFRLLQLVGMLFTESVADNAFRYHAMNEYPDEIWGSGHAAVSKTLSNLSHAFVVQGWYSYMSHPSGACA